MRHQRRLAFRRLCQRDRRGDGPKRPDGIEAVLGVLYRPVEKRVAARRRALILMGFTFACFLATLLNPYGWTLYPWVLKLLGDPTNVLNLWKRYKSTVVTDINDLQVPGFARLAEGTASLAQSEAGEVRGAPGGGIARNWRVPARKKLSRSVSENLPC